MKEYQQLIGGEKVPAVGGGTVDLINPAQETVIQKMPFGDGADADAAISAASEAFPSWSHTNAFERSQILNRAADIIQSRLDEFAPVTTEEAGKPIVQAKAEWSTAPNYLRFAAEEIKRVYGRWIPNRSNTRRIDVTYKPVGVIGVITAWNFPVYNVVRAWSSALAAGCTVVSRPSEYTPRSAMLLGEALTEAGAPAGVVNVINGRSHEIGQVMLDDARCRKISFTGSTRVGKLLIEGAARTVTKLALELGGNAPVIIFPDAGDLGRLASEAITSKVRNCGQVCVAPQRFYVHRSIVDEFVELSAAAADSQVVGDGSDPATTVGPLINAKQRDRVEELVELTIEQGARLVIGGKRLDRPGYFYAPTVLVDVKPGTPLHEEEVFGPVLPIIPFDTTSEAIEMANSAEFGLAAYIHSNNLATAMIVSEELEYGLVGVNDWYVAVPEAPFGGMKQSGLGRESGPEGIMEYLEPKTRFFGGIA